jgi:hypothetical protein
VHRAEDSSKETDIAKGQGRFAAPSFEKALLVKKAHLMKYGMTMAMMSKKLNRIKAICMVLIFFFFFGASSSR